MSQLALYIFFFISFNYVLHVVNNTSIKNMYQNEIEVTYNDLNVLVGATKLNSKKVRLQDVIFLPDYKDICVNITTACQELDIKCSPNSLTKLSYEQIKNICAYSLKNSLTPGCDSVGKYEKDTLFISKSPWKAWLYALTAVLIICLCSANGCFLYPIMKKTFFKKSIMFFIALAIGVLLSSGLLQLLPNALQYDPLVDISYLYKFICVIFGVYFFIVFEVILKSSIAWRRGIPVPDFKESCCSGQSSDQNNRNRQKYETVDGPITTSSNSQSLNILCTNFSGDTNTKNETHQICQQKKKSNPFYKPTCFQPNISSIALLIIVGDMAHNFVDGVAIGSSFAESVNQGLSLSVAVFCEEFPHELGDFAVLVGAGMTVWQAFFWNMLASLTCFFGCIIGLVIGINEYITEFVDAFCAGMFIYLALVGMLPEVIDMMVECSEGLKSKYIFNMIVSLVGILIGIIFMITMSFTSYKILQNT